MDKNAVMDLAYYVVIDLESIKTRDEKNGEELKAEA